MNYQKKMVVGSSWKIYFKSITKSLEYIEVLGKNLDFVDESKLEIYTLPDFISLGAISTLERNPLIHLGAQDMFWEDQGPYTGEVSPLLLKDIGCKYVYIGHSERRIYFGENDHTINQKVLAAYRNGLIPILLVGETWEEYKAGQTAEVLRQQLGIALEGIPASFLKELVLVYEPRWAIGKKETASREVIQKSHLLVQEAIGQLYGQDMSSVARVIYGGSVNYDNSQDIIKIPEVDGLAITRGALDPAEFVKIIKLVAQEAGERAGRNNQV